MKQVVLKPGRDNSRNCVLPCQNLNLGRYVQQARPQLPQHLLQQFASGTPRPRDLLDHHGRHKRLMRRQAQPFNELLRDLLLIRRIVMQKHVRHAGFDIQFHRAVF
jgi:hypothetical protein